MKKKMAAKIYDSNDFIFVPIAYIQFIFKFGVFSLIFVGVVYICAPVWFVFIQHANNKIYYLLNYIRWSARFILFSFWFFFVLCSDASIQCACVSMRERRDTLMAHRKYFREKKRMNHTPHLK